MYSFGGGGCQSQTNTVCLKKNLDIWWLPQNIIFSKAINTQLSNSTYPHILVVCGCTWSAIARAVCLLSPVNMYGSTPIKRRVRMALAASSRTVSAIATTASSFPKGKRKPHQEKENLPKIGAIPIPLVIQLILGSSSSSLDHPAYPWILQLILG